MEMYKGYPKSEIKEATALLRNKGATDEQIKQAFEDAEHPMLSFTVQHFGIGIAMIEAYKLRNGGAKK